MGRSLFVLCIDFPFKSWARKHVILYLFVSFVVFVRFFLDEPHAFGLFWRKEVFGDETQVSAGFGMGFLSAFASGVSLFVRGAVVSIPRLQRRLANLDDVIAASLL